MNSTQDHPGEDILEIESLTTPGIYYYLSLSEQTCSCPAFSFGKGPCKHLRIEMAKRESLAGD